MRTIGERSICSSPDRWRWLRSEVSARPRRARRPEHLLEQLGHRVTLLRNVLPGDSTDEAVLEFAHNYGCLLLTCNRDDFLQLARTKPHHGIVIVIRRRNRADERAALFRLLDRAGERGLRDNVDFA